jgi:hypothetical protein
MNDKNVKSHKISNMEPIKIRTSEFGETLKKIRNEENRSESPNRKYKYPNMFDKKGGGSHIVQNDLGRKSAFKQNLTLAQLNAIT